MLLLRRYDRLDERVVAVLPRGGCLEAPPTSKHPTIAWGNGEWAPVCDGFRVDGKREHQRLREEGSACESHRACTGYALRGQEHRLIRCLVG